METVKFSEVAHLYKGCKVKLDNSIDHTLVGVCHDLLTIEPVKHIPYQYTNMDVISDRVKPMLRPLSSMTEEEQYSICRIKTNNKNRWASRLVSYENGIISYQQYENRGQVGTGTYEWYDYKVNLKELLPLQFTYILSKHFDLFGLIETGEATTKQ